MFIINPIGDFPLNDDWSYAKPVQSLLNGEGIRFTGWMSMTLFAQVLWGSLWCKIFGFSFTVLRFSTLFLGGIGVVYTYKLFKIFIDDNTNAFFLTLLILFNPIYLNLSYTFMTDVPFYALSIISIFYYLQYIKGGSLKFVLIASFFVVLAILIRQLALVIPFAFLITGFYKLLKKEKVGLQYFLPFVISIGIYIGYQWIAHSYFDARGRYDEMNGKLMSQILTTPISWLLGVFNRNVIGLLYLTLFSSPFLISYLIKSKKVIIAISVVIGTLFFLFLNSKDYIFPILDNIIYNFGLGPATLYDYWFGDIQEPHQVNTYIWIGITIFVSILFSLILTLFVSNKSEILSKVDDKKIFISLTLIGYLMLVASISTYDRYYLLPMPLFIIIVFSFLKVEIRRSVFLFMLIPISIFSVAGTHDYLSWNKARWDCISYSLRGDKVDSNRIDGGFEFNGWYNYNDTDFNSRLKNVWVHDVDYIIGFNRLKGTDVIYEANYMSWLQLENASIKVLKKNGDFEEMEKPFFPKTGVSK